MAEQTLQLQSADPSPPSAGWITIYTKDGSVWTIDEFGVTTRLTGAAEEVPEAQRLILKAVKGSSGSLAAGTAIYAVGWDAVNEVVRVEAARADSWTTMPCCGIVEGDTITDTVVGDVIFAGTLTNLNTAGYSLRDKIYVSASIAGALTDIAPTGPNITQCIGLVTRVDGTDGRMQIAPGNVLPASDSAPLELGSASPGISIALAREDHIHAHGDQAGGSLHVIATVSVAGFMSAADKTKLDSLPDDAVSEIRVLNAGAGMTGGGDLSADRTFDVVANADGSIQVNADDIQVGTLATDGQHGTRGGGTQHAVVSGVSNGFMSSTDKTKLDNSGELASLAPTDVNAGDSAVVGTGTTAARQDHEHGVSTAAAIGLTANSANTEGTATSLARSDHTHDLTTGVASGIDASSTNTEGTSANLARADHTHDIGTASAAGLTVGGGSAEGTGASIARADHTHAISAGAPVAITDATNAEGSSTNFVRADHQHAHGDRGGGSLHATATTLTNGFMSSTDKTKLDNSGALTSNPPTDVNAGDSASVGVGTTSARADHEHGVATATAVGLDSASTNTEGTAINLARADHTHEIAETGTLSSIDAGDTASDGTAAGFARKDHQHAVSTGVPVNVEGGSNSAGISTNLARSDHQHRLEVDVLEEGASAGQRPIINFIGAAVTVADDPGNDRVNVTVAAAALTSSTPASVDAGDAGVVGVATDAARADHQHGVSTGAASGLDSTSTNTEGTSTNLARADHTHEISETGTVTSVNAGDSASDGTAAGFARKDHEHGVATAAPVDVNSPSNSEGTSTSLARADHQHRLEVNVLDEGILAGQRPSVNFTGSAVTATDDAGNDRVNVTISAAALTSNPPVQIDAGDSAVVGIGTAAARDDHQHAVNVADGTISTINAGDSAVEGTGAGVSRRDHQHAVATAAAVGINATSINTEGSAVNLARADHTHEIDETGTVGTVNAGDTPADGTATGFARKDHEHGVSTATASSLNTSSTSTEGVAVSLARSDHTHEISETGSITNVNAGDTASDGAAAGFARKDHEHGVSTAAPVAASLGTTASEGTATSLARSDHIHQSNTAPADVTKAAASIGTSTEPARADHKHDVSTAAPVTQTPDQTNAEGTATSLARSDHVHNIAAAAPTIGIGAGNSEGTSNSFARADHNHAIRTGTTELTIGTINDGEVLRRSGGTINSTPAGIFGANHQIASETVANSTSNTTFQDYLTLTTPPSGTLTGTYRVAFTAEFDSVDKDGEVRLGDITGGTPGTSRYGPVAVQPKIATDHRSISGWAYVIFSAEQRVFSVQYRSVGGQTVGLRNALIEFWRVS